jgi:hypothetical protein
MAAFDAIAGIAVETTWMNFRLVSMNSPCKYPPAEPVALRLLAPQRDLIATVEKQKQEQKQKNQQFAACNDID